MKIDLTDSEKKEILWKFDKSNIQKRLQEMPRIDPATIDKNEVAVQGSGFDAVKNMDGTYRTYDKATGFQSNHITSSNDGEWRTCFDRGQADQLGSLSKAWLLKNGYEV